MQNWKFNTLEKGHIGKACAQQKKVATRSDDRMEWTKLYEDQFSWKGIGISGSISQISLETILRTYSWPVSLLEERNSAISAWKRSTESWNFVDYVWLCYSSLPCSHLFAWENKSSKASTSCFLITLFASTLIYMCSALFISKCIFYITSIASSLSYYYYYYYYY